MAYTWKINNVEIGTLGLEIAACSLRTHGVSKLTLRRFSNYDTTALYSYGQDITVTYDAGSGDTPFFKGRIASVPKFGSGSAEGQEYVIEDVWADLERTVYQEAWKINGGSTVMMPRAVFGMDTAGTRITVGAMIGQVIDAAITAGVDIAKSVPVTGEIPLPSEIINRTCDEVLLDCLRLHPDWIPWIDHRVAGDPVFTITPLSSSGTTTIVLDGGTVKDFTIIKRDDLLPDSVRVVYESAEEVDAEIYRKFYLDKYPAGGPDAGPNVLQAYVALQGARVSIQKQRLYCKTIPTDESHERAKDFIREHYPALSGLDDADFNVTDLTLELIPEDEEEADNPVSPRSSRISVTTTSDLPRELVKGSIEDWMRYKVGRIKVSASISATGTATPTESALMGTLAPVVVTGTNAPAGSKLAKGISNYEAAESIPTGIAQAVYDGITAARAYEGSVTIVADEMPAGQYLGTKLRFTGGDADWTSMSPPVWAVDWDLDTREVTLSFGPPSHLAPQDFIELQRIVRGREVRWFNTDERDSDKFGSPGASSALGDVVGGYDIPVQITAGGTGGGGGTAGAFLTIYVAADGHTYLQGGSVTGGTGVETAADIKIIDSGTGPTQTAGTHMYVIATGDGITADGVLLPGWNLTNASVGYASTVPDNTLPTASSSTGKLCHIDLGVFTSTGFLPAGAGNIQISHCLGSYSVSRDQ